MAPAADGTAVAPVVERVVPAAAGVLAATRDAAGGGLATSEEGLAGAAATGAPGRSSVGDDASPAGMAKAPAGASDAAADDQSGDFAGAVGASALRVAMEASASAPATASVTAAGGSTAQDAGSVPGEDSTALVMHEDGAVLPALAASQQDTVRAGAPPAGVSLLKGATRAKSGGGAGTAPEGASPGRVSKGSAAASALAAAGESRHRTAGSGATSTEREDAGTKSAGVATAPDADQPDAPSAPAPVIEASAASAQGSAMVQHLATPAATGGVQGPASSESGSVMGDAGQRQTLPVPSSAPVTGSAPVLSSAQLIQSVRHSEMRLGMQSEEFGSLSISASLGRQALSAQISTEHLELGRALAMHMPAVEQKLSTAYGVPVKVEVSSGSAANASPGQTSQGDRQGAGGNGARQAVALPTNPMRAGSATVGSVVPEMALAAVSVSSRLDVRV